MMTTEKTSKLSASACDIAVEYLLEEAHRDQAERRDLARQPFFRNVIVAVPHGDGYVRFSCFSRDVSAGGIGLLHHFPLECGEVVVTIYSQSLGPVRMRGEIAWCERQLDGWHTSGCPCRFLQRPKPTTRPVLIAARIHYSMYIVRSRSVFCCQDCPLSTVGLI